MVLNYIPTGAGSLGREDPGEAAVFGGPRHYLCGVVGLAVAAGALALTYSVLVGLASAVPLLSTTAVTFAGIVLWVVTWLLLDAVVFWASDRATPDD